MVRPEGGEVGNRRIGKHHLPENLLAPPSSSYDFELPSNQRMKWISDANYRWKIFIPISSLHCSVDTPVD